MTTNGHTPGVRPVIGTDLSELDKLRALHSFDQPSQAQDVVSIAQLAVRDGSTGETRVSWAVEHYLLTSYGPLRRYLSPDEADELAELLKLNARQARSGIIAVSTPPTPPRSPLLG